MLVADKVTVPDVVFVKEIPVPPSIALIVPDCTAYEAAVMTPVVPEIVPPVSVRSPVMVVENVAVLNVPEP